MSRRICLAAYSLEEGHGGVAQVAALMARVLMEEAPRLDLEPHAIVLRREKAPPDIGIPAVSARGSKLKFIAMVHQEGLRSSHFLYDSCNMAQSHPRVPSFKRPCLTYIHGIEVWEDAKQRRLRAAQRSDLMLANSQFTRDKADELHGGFEDAKVCWLGTSPTAETRLATPPASARHTVPEALIVSRIDAREDYKGHRELIAEWPEVMARVPEARLHVAGKGSGLAEMKTLAARKGLSEHIVFHGFVPDEDLDRLYQHCRLFAMPSRGEGFGLVYADAMRHRRPVIVSTEDAGQEVIENGVTGFAVDLQREGALAERLSELLSKGALAERMGDAGHERWREHFTYAKFKERFSAHIQELLKE